LFIVGSVAFLFFCTFARVKLIVYFVNMSGLLNYIDLPFKYNSWLNLLCT